MNHTFDLSFGLIVVRTEHLRAEATRTAKGIYLRDSADD